MNIADITQLIGSLGFPIIACGALFWKMNEQDKSHKEETEMLTKALENNTIALTKLLDKLEGDE